MDADRDWWRGAVIYQIYPRSFQDSNGDGIGDLAGIIHRLPYVASLGVDAIWISPFYASPMKDFGYDVSAYRDIEPMFGTMSDFDALIERAHQLDLRVMIDLVLSHTSDQHRWFRESRSSRDNPKANWYVWADAKPDGSPPNNWLSIFGGSAWEWDGERMQYYLHNFLIEQPDLNFHDAGGAGRASGRGAVLAGTRRGRIPLRHREFLRPRRGAARQSGASGREPRLLHGARGEPLQLAGASLRQEPAGEPGLPAPDAGADGRVSGRRGGRRDRRRAARHGADGRIHPRRRHDPHVLRVRVPVARRADGNPGRGGAGEILASRLGGLGVLGVLEP